MDKFLRSQSGGWRVVFIVSVSFFIGTQIALQFAFANTPSYTGKELVATKNNDAPAENISSKDISSVKGASSTLLEGVAHYKSKNYEKALEYLTDSLKGSQKKESSLKDYSYYYLGLTYEALGELKKARRAFIKLDATQSHYYLKRLGLFHLAQIEVRLKRWRSAYRRLKYLERRIRTNPEHGKILGLLSYVEKKKRRMWSSCRWAKRLYRKYPNDPVSTKWEGGLQSVPIYDTKINCLASFADQKKRLRHLQLTGHAEKAQTELNLMKEFYGEGSYRADRLQAEFWSQQGYPKQALKLLLLHYKKKNKDRRFLNSLAKIAFRSGDVELSISVYNRLYEISPRRYTGKKALFRSAFTSYQYGDYDGAIQKFLKLKKEFSSSRLTSQATWHIAWINYLKGQSKLAYHQIKNILKNKKRRPRRWRRYPKEQLQYWLAMAAEKMGDSQKSKEIFRDMASKNNLNYYNLLAQDRLQTLEPLSSHMGFLKNLNSYSEEPSSDAPLEPLKLSHRSEYFFTRYEKIKDTQLRDWAQWELREIERRTRDRRLLRKLMAEYHDLNIFNRSSYIGQIYFAHSTKKEPFSRQNNVWDYTYPKAYVSEVEQATHYHELEKEFIWAIMRAESKYRSSAVSPVGALGLMQVMPNTGKKIANILDVSFKKEDLFVPKKSVYLGTGYLKRLMLKFGQTLPLAAAAYNAGPHRVVRWAHYFGKDLELDEFIEHIPFNETRKYVKKVMSNYQVYSILNKSESNLRLAQGFELNHEGALPMRESWE